jgi:hypothetical protein
VEQAIENGASGRHIAEQFAPFFDGAVRGHHGRAVFVATHDDSQKDFATFGRKDFESHIVSEIQVDPEIVAIFREYHADAPARPESVPLDFRGPQLIEERTAQITIQRGGRLGWIRYASRKASRLR